MKLETMYGQAVALFILVGIPMIITGVLALIISGIAMAFKAIRRSVWYRNLWYKVFPNDYTPWTKEQGVGECDECGEVLLKSDEIPGYSKIYECPSCGHPNGRM